MVEKVRQGTWKSESIWYGLEHGIVDIYPMGSMVPEAVQKRVLAKKAEIASGKDKVFVGPIKDQSGKLRIPKDTPANDKELLGMTWFVEGVVGTTQ
jgi:basic membrane protein A